MNGDGESALARELERRNAVLEEQVKLLVRTEHKLYLSQRELARQLARVDALNRFAIDVAGLESPIEIVARAADVLFALFPLDHCVGFLANADDSLSPVAVRAAPGREPPSLLLRARDREPIPFAVESLTEAVVDCADAIHARRTALAPLLARVERVLSNSTSTKTAGGEGLVLVIPISRGARAAGVMVFRYDSGPISFHDELPSANDLAFLGVFAQQVAAALANARLVQRERLAALGELAAMVAHEVRNPLGAIFNSLAMLERLVDGRSHEEHLLGIVREESERLNQIVSDLIEFARPHPPAPQEESLVTIARAAIETVRARFAQAAIQLHTEEPLPRVWADARTVRQALINLLVNALQASPDDCEVEVRLGPAHEGRVRVAVVDRGPGVPEGAAARIFEPFYTTKATGTGLGLAVVKRVADAHGGVVEARRTTGGGATFTFTVSAAPLEDRSAPPDR